MKFLQSMILVMAMLLAANANALDVLGYLTDADGKYSGPTVEEKVVEMDADKNGFADVYEIREYLAKRHGDDYQKTVLDRWEFNANPNSCGTTSFAEDLVANKQ